MPFTKNKASSRKEENFNEENLNLNKKEEFNKPSSQTNVKNEEKPQKSTKELKSVNEEDLKGLKKRFSEKGIKKFASIVEKNLNLFNDWKAQKREVLEKIKKAKDEEDFNLKYNEILEVYHKGKDLNAKIEDSERILDKMARDEKHDLLIPSDYLNLTGWWGKLTRDIFALDKRMSNLIKYKEHKQTKIVKNNIKKLKFDEALVKSEEWKNEDKFKSILAHFAFNHSYILANKDKEQKALVKEFLNTLKRLNITFKEQKNGVLEFFQKEFEFQTGEPKGIKELRNELKEALEPYKNKEIINKNTHLKAYITSEELNKISSTKAVQKSVDNGFSRDEHFRVAEDLKNLFENAQLSQTHEDTKKRANINAVYRFKKDILINDKEAEAKITVLEKIEGNNKIYTIELESLNKPAPLNASVPSKEAATQAQSVETAHKEPTTIAKVEEEIIPKNKEIKSASEKDLNDRETPKNNYDYFKEKYANRKLDIKYLEDLEKEVEKQNQKEIFASRYFKANGEPASDYSHVDFLEEKKYEYYKIPFSKEKLEEINDREPYTGRKQAGDLLAFNLMKVKMANEEFNYIPSDEEFDLIFDAFYVPGIREKIENEFNIKPLKKFGFNYAEFYHDGERAIKKLIGENEVFKQSGQKGEFKAQVAGAFHREELGDIDLVWGDEKFGLKHIIAKHGEEFKDIAKDLSEIVEKGKLIKQNDVRYRLEYENAVIGLSGEFKGEKRAFIITAFNKNEGKSSTLSPKQDFTDKSDNALSNQESIIPQSKQIRDIKKQLAKLKKEKLEQEKYLKSLKEDEQEHHRYALEEVLKQMRGLYKQLPENLRYTEKVIDDLTELKAILKGNDYSMQKAIKAGKIAQRLNEQAIIEDKDFIERLVSYGKTIEQAKALNGTSWGTPKQWIEKGIYDFYQSIREDIDTIPAFKKISTDKTKNESVLHSNTHLGTGLITGTLSGVKEDEEGNFNFNPQDFIKGFLGGASASLAVKKGLEIKARSVAKNYSNIAKDNPALMQEIVKRDLSHYAKSSVANSLTRFLNKHKNLDLNSQIFAGEKALMNEAYKPQAKKLKVAKELEAKGKSEIQIWESTGWYKDKDKKWKFEISQKGGELQTKDNFGRPYKREWLVKILKDDELFSAYPQLKLMRVIEDKKLGAGVGGAYDYETKDIYIKNLQGKDVKTILYHEIQHAVQDIEGFGYGFKDIVLSDENFNLYYKQHGEAEARNVQRRLDTDNKREIRTYKSSIPINKRRIAFWENEKDKDAWKGHDQPDNEIRQAQENIAYSRQKIKELQDTAKIGKYTQHPYSTMDIDIKDTIAEATIHGKALSKELESSFFR
ncbi:LPD23 domain-containing protein [Campylobacter sp. VTCC 70190]|uniref:putative barnase/colicin E5 family endoribonuclease n=1 Tax=Campylobacter sp. VTCC 70190 TaxID=3392118 RepID=UPI00398F6C14